MSDFCVGKNLTCNLHSKNNKHTQIKVYSKTSFFFFYAKNNANKRSYSKLIGPCIFKSLVLNKLVWEILAIKLDGFVANNHNQVKYATEVYYK